MAARGLAPDRYDRLGPGFHARVAAGFRTIAAAEPSLPADRRERPSRTRYSQTPNHRHASSPLAPTAPSERLRKHRRRLKAAATSDHEAGQDTTVTPPDPRENPLLFGHAAAQAQILEAMLGGRMHHAWLITGAPGVGKATLAYRFARRLLAGVQPGRQLAVAATSPVFRRVAAGSHADLLTVEREWDDKKSRLRGEIVVDDARTISAFLRLTPAEGGWRVVVIDGAEHMNRNAANSVLKMLEEPPPRAVLLLTCAAPGRLLPTIRSRCRRLALAPLAAARDGRNPRRVSAGHRPVAERARLARVGRRVTRPGAAAGGGERAAPRRPCRRGARHRAAPAQDCAPSPSPSNWAAARRTASPRS